MGAIFCRRPGTVHGKMKFNKAKIQEIFLQKLSKKKQEKLVFRPKWPGLKWERFLPGAGDGAW